MYISPALFMIYSRSKIRSKSCLPDQNACHDNVPLDVLKYPEKIVQSCDGTNYHTQSLKSAQFRLRLALLDM